MCIRDSIIPLKLLIHFAVFIAADTIRSVSYTHLDVYKRQLQYLTHIILYFIEDEKPFARSCHSSWDGT